MRNASQGAAFKPLKLEPSIDGLEVVEPMSDLDSRLAWFEYQRATAQLHRKWSQTCLLALTPKAQFPHG